MSDIIKTIKPVCNGTLYLYDSYYHGNKDVYKCTSCNKIILSELLPKSLKCKENE